MGPLQRFLAVLSRQDAEARERGAHGDIFGEFHDLLQERLV